MKKKYIISIIIILFIILLIFILKFDKYKINNLNEINKTIVKITPETSIIDITNNPSWILNYNEYWIWSGFFINKNWNIITSLHNVSNKNINYYTIDYNNNKYKIQIINIDEKNDIAYIKIDSELNNYYLSLSNKKVNINDNIYSIWIKWEEDKVSYQTWTIKNIRDYIEFTPQIFKWFSGWPILNKDFEVVWVNYWIGDGRSYGVRLND